MELSEQERVYASLWRVKKCGKDSFEELKKKFEKVVKSGDSYNREIN